MKRGTVRLTMSIDTMIFNLRKLFHPDDFISERTRARYEEETIDPPIAPKFDETSTKYRGKN